MSDNEADPELLELLRQSLGWSSRPKDEISRDTGTAPCFHGFHICAVIGFGCVKLQSEVQTANLEHQLRQILVHYYLNPPLTYLFMGLRSESNKTDRRTERRRIYLRQCNRRFNRYVWHKGRGSKYTLGNEGAILF